MEAVSWLGVAMAAISMVGNVAMTISNNRTKAKIAENELKYARELSDIRNELVACRESHTSSEVDRAELRDRLAGAEARAADADKAAQAIRLELASIRGRLLAEESRPKQG